MVKCKLCGDDVPEPCYETGMEYNCLNLWDEVEKRDAARKRISHHCAAMPEHDHLRRYADKPDWWLFDSEGATHFNLRYCPWCGEELDQSPVMEGGVTREPKLITVLKG